DLAIPALRQLSASDYDRFVQRMRLVVDSDQRVDLFEFTLEKILQNHLDTHFQRRSRPRVRFNHVRNVAGASAILLSALARVGARGQTEAEQAAFQAGLSSLKVHEPRLHLELLPAAHCGLQAV